MRVDFYQLGAEPAEAVLPQIAAKALAAGERLAVVSGDAAQRAALSHAFWAAPAPAFLANGEAGGPDDARQPILIGAAPTAANGARLLALADGVWRAADGFSRVFFLFGAEAIEGARASWRALGEGGDAERHFWRRDGARWVSGP